MGDVSGVEQRKMTKCWEPLDDAQVAGEERLADNQGKRIGILIVAYNAVTTLGPVLRRIPSRVWMNVEEVVVFDDASQDSTYQLAVGYQVLSEAKKLKVIQNLNNLGYGGNQKAGYRYFMERGFDVVVLLHGDGQYAPEILARLYHPLVMGHADAVFGSRMLPDYGGPLKGGMPLYKYVGNRILTFFENRALGLNLSEFHSGYRAYSLAAIRQIDLTRMTDDFHFDTEIIIKLGHQGFCIKEVPIPTYYGKEICYVNGLRYARNVARAVYRYRRTRASIKCFPEFQEYFVHYPPKESKYSSHYYFQMLAGKNNDVLDLGCGNGFMAEKLAFQGNRVVGMDLLPEPILRNVFQDYISVDLRQGLQGVIGQLGGKEFDKVLLMDVLEHLPQPERLLQDCHAVLKSNGQLLVSVPNIANITVRLLLLAGRFDYTERGILDRTHFRFFTRVSIRRLLEQNGYQIVHSFTTVMPLELSLGLRAHNSLMKLANRLLAVATGLLPNLFGYQCVLVARSKHGFTAQEPLARS